jgi:hypothetical protein
MFNRSWLMNSQHALAKACRIHVSWSSQMHKLVHKQQRPSQCGLHKMETVSVFSVCQEAPAFILAPKSGAHQGKGSLYAPELWCLVAVVQQLVGPSGHYTYRDAAKMMSLRIVALAAAMCSASCLSPTTCATQYVMQQVIKQTNN